MNEENKTITIGGKEIDYGKLSDEELTQLYKDLKQRELVLYQRILKTLREANLIEE